MEPGNVIKEATITFKATVGENVTSADIKSYMRDMFQLFVYDEYLAIDVTEMYSNQRFFDPHTSEASIGVEFE